jgi:hypothetical protein
MKKILVRKKKKKESVKECDGAPCDAGNFGFGMGNPGPGGPDRFDMGFSFQEKPKKRSKKLKVRRKK